MDGKKRFREKVCDILKMKKAVSFFLVLFVCVSLFGSFSLDLSSAVSLTGLDIRGYVAVNGVWKQVAMLDTADGNEQWTSSGNGRFYITAETAEKMFGEYGFKAADYNGETIFPHTDSYDPNNIWADTAAKNVDGEWRIPISFRKANYIYYMPANLPGSAAFVKTKTTKTDSKVLRANSFYTCTVMDPDAKVYTDTSKIPTVAPVFTGKTMTVTVKAPTDFEWNVVDPESGDMLDHALTDNGDGTVTITVENVTTPIYVTSGKYDPTAHTIRYEAATLEENFATLGNFTPLRQQVYEDGSVRGGKTYTMYGDTDDGHSVLSPDSELAISLLLGGNGDPSNGRKFFYVFKGWEIYGNGKIVQPGEVLSYDELNHYSVNGEVLFRAVWEATDANGRIASVNFFVNLYCEISDNMSNGFQTVAISEFSDCVHSSHLTGSESISGTGDYLLIAPPTSEDTAVEVDEQLRNTEKTPVGGVTIDSFPSDESVFAKLRASGKSFYLDGVPYSGESLTSDNFTIRWYVLKYEHSDGWHVDGVLVQKRARITVTKTFGGDDEAVALVKNGDYGILVRHDDTESRSAVTDYTLCLDPLGEEKKEGTLGYDSYDPETQTYMWSFVARRGREYFFDEKGYMLEDTVKWHNSNSYMISNSDMETNGWLPYDINADVRVVAQAYPDDVTDAAIQTVSFRNIYVQAGLLSVTKIDSETNHGLKNIAFKVSSADGTELRLYKKKNRSQYSADTNAPADGYPEPVENNLVTTDGTGNFFIKLPVGSYYLEEDVPLGYDGARKILVTVTDEGIIKVATTVISGDVEPEGGWIDGVGTAVLTVKNRSKLLTVVRAEKDWGDTPEEDRLPVKVDLYRNGSKMVGEIYSQTLSEENGWAYEWYNLPLYTDGEVAVYTLRETHIGDSAYDPSVDADGYADYLVSTDPALYREGTASEYGAAAVWADSSGKRHFADHCLLRIHNRQSTGEIAFTKTDSFGTPLGGAEFTLYSDAECTKVLAKAVSEEGSGFVTFSMRPFGTYYLKETKAPDGYIAEDDTYVVLVRGGVVTIVNSVGNGEPVTKIKNDALMSLTVKKVNTVGQTLADAEFEILKNESLYAKFTTGEDGTFHLSNMPDGEYRIVETKAPTGYKERPDFAVITILAGKVSVTSAKTNGWTLSDDGNGDFTLTVVNDVIYDLPTVGGNGVYTYIIVGGALMLAATAVLVAVTVFSKRRKK